MSKLFTTGPVENAVGTPAVTVLVKILNNRTANLVTARVVLYNVEGTKQQISTITLSVPVLSSDYASFQVDVLRQYEIQIEVDQDEAVLISVWSLDGDGNLIAAQRFVHTELKEYSVKSSKTRKLKMPSRKIRKRSRR